MASQDEMLRALHKADPKTLNQRYNSQQLQAAFAKLKAPAAAPAPAAPVAPAAPAATPLAPAPQAPALTAAPSQVATPSGPAGSPMVATPTMPATAEIGQNNLSRTGAGIAEGQLQSGVVSQPFQFNADDQARQRIEEQAFARLTRGIDDQEKRAMAEAKTSLSERGIPYSNDPSSRYQQELKDITTRFDTARGNARQDATVLGGQEMERNYNISSGAYNTTLGGINQLSQVGLQGTLGFEGNKLQAQATQAAIDKANKDREAQILITNKNNAAAKALARLKMGRSGGGGSSDDGFGLVDPGGSSASGL